MANPRKQKDFKRSDLEKLGQPFRVTVHQDVGGRKTPVSLPPLDPGLEPGTGFTPDAAEKLGQVLPHLGGGGLYNCHAMDDAGNVVEWDWWFDPNIIPRKATEQLAAAAVKPPPVVLVSTPAGPAPVAAMMPAAQPAAQQPFGYFFQGLQQQQQVAAPAPSSPTFRAPLPPSAPPNTDPFEDPLWKERSERLKLEYEMKMQQATAALEAQFANKIRSLEQMTAAAARPVTDPAADARLAAMEQQLAAALKATEEANRRADKLAEDAKREREREEMLGMIKAVNDSTQAAIGQLAQTIAAQAQQRPAGPDPTTQLLIASVERQGEMYRQVLDLMGRNVEGASKNAMTLADVLTIMNTLNQQGGASTVVSKMSEGMGTMLDVFRSIMELKAQMDGGGKSNPIVETAGQAISSIAEGVQAYIQSKRDENVAKSNAESVRAQADAAKAVGVANAQAQAVAGRSSWAPPPPTTQAAPAAASAAASEPAPEPEPEQPTTIDGAEQPEAGSMEAAAESVPDDPREKEIFGAALGHVKKLRVAVADGGIDAMGIAQMIATAGAKIKALHLNVPVFKMYEERMFAPVVEACLPEAHPELRRQVAEILANVGREQLIIQTAN